MMRKRLAVAATAAAVVLLLAGGIAQAASVSIGDNFYSPETVTIAVGETVTWTNDGQAPHTVTADNGSFDSSPNCPDSIETCMQTGDTFSHTFDSAGTFSYFCKVHGQSMSGTVVVQGAGGTPSPTGTGSPLPNTGGGDNLTLFFWVGLVLVVGGGAVLFALQRRQQA